MGGVLAEDGKAAVRSNAHLRVLQDGGDVLLGHQVIDHSGAARPKHVAGGFELGLGRAVSLELDRHVLQGKPLERRIGRVGGDHGEGEILEPSGGKELLHARLDPLPGGRIVQAFLRLFGTTFQNPVGEADGEGRGGGGVGVLVCPDVHAPGAGGVDESESLAARSPVARAVDLEVGDLHRTAGRLSDGDGLGHGLFDLGAFVPHVGGVEAACCAGHAGQLGDLGRLGPGSGGVLKPCREAHRPILHGLGDEGLHLFHLGGSGSAALFAHHRLPDRVVADQGGVVDRRPSLADRGEGLADLKGRRTAVARHDRGHPHPQVVLRPGSLREVVRVGMDVDEARSYDQPGSIDHPCRLGCGEVADLRNSGDLAVLNRHVRPDSGRAGAVDDRSSADDEIVGWGRGKEEGEEKLHGITSSNSPDWICHSSAYVPPRARRSS